MSQPDLNVLIEEKNRLVTANRRMRGVLQRCLVLVEHELTVRLHEAPVSGRKLLVDIKACLGDD